MMLDIFADIEKEHGYHDQRFAIEHAQHMAQKDFERFAKLHVIASMQPYHAIDDGRWAEARLGHERARYSYAWRSFLDHGVTLAFGTDWPVAPLDPILGVYAAVTRATLDGKNPGGWIPEEKSRYRKRSKPTPWARHSPNFRKARKAPFHPANSQTWSF